MKLVRDKIPNKLNFLNAGVSYRTARKEEMPKLLVQKLMEEVGELVNAGNVDDITDELADVLQVLHSLALQNEIDWWAVEDRFYEKHDDKGGFAQRQVLEVKEVIERPDPRKDRNA